MVEAIIFASVWAAVLLYVAASSKEVMQLTWIVLIGLLLASPIIAIFWPAFR